MGLTFLILDRRVRTCPQSVGFNYFLRAMSRIEAGGLVLHLDRELPFSAKQSGPLSDKATI